MSKVSNSNFSWTLAAVLVGLFLAAFTALNLFYLIKSTKAMVLGETPFMQLLWWMIVGLSFSLLASLTAWPFALSAATLIQHNRSRKITPYILKCLTFISTFPLILFAYIYIEILGAKSFAALESVWMDSFASPNLVTQSIAFALTLLFYPLAVIPVIGESLTIDEFFRRMLGAVLEFAEVGLVASVIVCGLFLYILPKMILHMRQQLQEDESLLGSEIIKSLGGTPWESIHLTVMQSMKSRFNLIITYFTRICFFEGLITYTLLHLFILSGTTDLNHWGSSLGSMYLSFSLNSQAKIDALLSICGALSLCFIILIAMENRFRSRRAARNV